jgi:hypothetical protein
LSRDFIVEVTPRVVERRKLRNTVVGRWMKCVIEGPRVCTPHARTQPLTRSQDDRQPVTVACGFQRSRRGTTGWRFEVSHERNRLFPKGLPDPTSRLLGQPQLPYCSFPPTKQHISSNIMSDDEGGGRTRRGGYRIEVVSTNRLAGCKGEHPKLELHQQFIHAHSDIAFVHRSKALQWRVHSASRSVLPVGLITTICDVE